MNAVETPLAARRALAYLAETDPLPAAPFDAIIGFGVFDLRLPRFCGELFLRGLAPRIIFTGGIGAGTGTFEGREADIWREELRRTYPQIGDAAVILENRSTHTAENIQFTAALLARTQPSLAFGAGVRRAIIVASPSRLRRVRLTLQRLQPELHVCRQLPAFTFEAEQTLYASHGIDYVSHLSGELDRLVDYPSRGWIAAEPLPAEIATVRAFLRKSLTRAGGIGLNPTPRLR
jgi:uncharacterized SAM-binding protein YcdF (DUF218 family)